jgi:hypothetical protein
MHVHTDDPLPYWVGELKPAPDNNARRAAVSSLAMDDQLVFIPCRLDRRDARSAIIEDADGWPRRVVSPLGRVDGRLVVAECCVREAAGRHRVRFGDGAELWVVQGPGRAVDFVPLAWRAGHTSRVPASEAAQPHSAASGV